MHFFCRYFWNFQVCFHNKLCFIVVLCSMIFPMPITNLLLASQSEIFVFRFIGRNTVFTFTGKSKYLVEICVKILIIGSSYITNILNLLNCYFFQIYNYGSSVANTGVHYFYSVPLDSKYLKFDILCMCCWRWYVCMTLNLNSWHNSPG